MLLFFVLIVALVVALTLFGVRGRLAVQRATTARCPSLPSRWRRILVVRVGALVLAGLMAVVTGVSGELGQGLALAPATVGVVLVVGALFGDLVVTVPLRGAQSESGASPTPTTRSVLEFVPRGAAAAVALGSVALFALAAWTTSVAVPDDQGRTGRAFGVSGLNGSAPEVAFASETNMTLSPFPGSYYVGPIAGGMLLLAAMLFTTVMVVARRMCVAGDDPSMLTDDVVRLRTAEGALAGAGAGVGATIVGLAWAAAWAVGLAAEASPESFQLSLWVLRALVPAGVLLTAWSLMAYLVPGSKREEQLVTT